MSALLDGLDALIRARNLHGALTMAVSDLDGPQRAAFDALTEAIALRFDEGLELLEAHQHETFPQSAD